MAGSPWESPGRRRCLLRREGRAPRPSSPLRTEIELTGEKPIPHRLPLRASAFDDLGHVTLIAETAEHGTAVAGPGWLVFDDVEGLAQPLVARLAQTGPGATGLELQAWTSAGWHTVSSARLSGADRSNPPGQVPTWFDVPLVPPGDIPPDRARLRVRLIGQIAIAEIRAA